MNALSAWLELIPIPGMAVGAASCFYGYRIHRFMVSASGYITGAAIGIAVGFFGGGLAGGPVGGVVLGAIFALVLGPIGVITARIREVTSIFLVGAVVGGGAGIALGAGSGSIQAALPLSIFLAILGGSIAVAIRRLLIMLWTAFTGASLLVGSAWMLSGGFSPEQVVEAIRGRGSSPFLVDLGGVLFAAFLVGAAGGVFQLCGGKREKQGTDQALPDRGAGSCARRDSEPCEA